MTGKDKFDLRMTACGENLREERIADARSMTQQLFKDDPSYRGDVFLWKDQKESVVAARVYEHKYRDAGTPRRQIQTLYDYPIAVGDVFLIGNEGYWLCVEAFNAHNINWQGTLEYCNLKLRFLLDNNIKEYPVVIKNATQYNSGETDKPQMTIGSSQHLIYISADLYTLQFHHGQRFLIDKNIVNPTAYRLTQMDTTSYSYGEKGIIQLTVVEDQYSPTYDNKELMIANFYKGSNGQNSIENNNYSVNIAAADGDVRIVCGDTKRFIITVKKGEEKIPDLKLNIEILQDEPIAHLSEVKEREFTIALSDNISYIGKEFVLHVYNSDYRIESKIKLKVGDLW